MVIPPIANFATGLRTLWTQALPGTLFHAIAGAGLLDLWLLFDLLAATGVLGVLAIVMHASGSRLFAATLLAVVAMLSLAAVLGESLGLILWYGLAYGTAAIVTYPSGFMRERSSGLRRSEGDNRSQKGESV
ncbi:hypothetical protein ACIBHX_20420 [Nonomuraea sp. NPDC050536]|uniref:hypothetical protein n=1 Tax=Nonomuraea sp. NPDC050536 TaxID=3364366 RepID=UPI0037CC8749